MKSRLIPLILAAGLCGAIVWLPDACGQHDPSPARTVRPGTASRIAFIDLGLILRQYKKTEDAMQDVKEQVEASNAKIKQMIGEGQELEKPLKDGTLEQESPEFRELERKLVKLSTSVSVFKSTKEKEFKRGEAKALLAIYRDVAEAVQLFAEQNGYTLVLRIDRESAKSYMTVSQTMSQPVVRHESRDDITDAVVAWLNKQYAAAGGAAERSAARGSVAGETSLGGKSASREVPQSGNRKSSAR